MRPQSTSKGTSPSNPARDRILPHLKDAAGAGVTVWKLAMSQIAEAYRRVDQGDYDAAFDCISRSSDVLAYSPIKACKYLAQMAGTGNPSAVKALVLARHIMTECDYNIPAINALFSHHLALKDFEGARETAHMIKDPFERALMEFEVAIAYLEDGWIEQGSTLCREICRNGEAGMEVAPEALFHIAVYQGFEAAEDFRLELFGSERGFLHARAFARMLTALKRKIGNRDFCLIEHFAFEKWPAPDKADPEAGKQKVITLAAFYYCFKEQQLTPTYWLESARS